MSMRMRARRPRRDRPRPITTVLRGTVIVAVASVLAVGMLRLYDGLPTTTYGKLYVSTPTVGNLLSHDAVRIGGKRVGQVLSVDLGSDGRPRVELQLTPGTEIAADTRVLIRANGLLGARFVELRPGDARALLDDGATIQGTAASYTYGLPEAVDVFNRETRDGLRETFGELGTGMLANGRGLNGSLQDLSVGPGQFEQLADAVLARRGSARRLLPSLSAGVEALDRGADAVPEFPRVAADAVTPFVTRRTAVRDTLAKAPQTLAAAEQGMRRGRVLLSAVRGFTTEADRTLVAAPEGLTSLSTLLDRGRRPLRRAVPVLRSTPTSADAARKIIVALERVAPDAAAGVKLARPFVDYVGAYGCDIANSGAVLRSMTGFSQPGRGPLGPAMAFRAIAVVPSPSELLGITDETASYKRDSYEPPCKYLSKPYPTLIPGDPSPPSAAPARKDG